MSWVWLRSVSLSFGGYGKLCSVQLRFVELGFVKLSLVLAGVVRCGLACCVVLGLR